MSKTCATCNWWYPNREPEAAAAIREEEKDCKDDGWWGCGNPATEGMTDGGGLCTKPEFGCIFHEECIDDGDCCESKAASRAIKLECYGGPGDGIAILVEPGEWPPSAIAIQVGGASYSGGKLRVVEERTARYEFCDEANAYGFVGYEHG